MDRQPFRTLARMIQTLAVGQAITLPFAMGARETEWSETFVVGRERIDHGHAVLHSTTYRKNGVTREQPADACDWDLDAMLQQIVEWDDDTFAYVERALLPLHQPGHTVEAIADLEDGPGVAVAAGRVWRRVDAAIRLATDERPQWSLDETVMAVRSGR